MKNLIIIFFFFTALFISEKSFSQTDSTSNKNSDTLIYQGDEQIVTDNPNKKSPGRAALFSAVLPGAGQVYNGKYWKVPLVYSALGTTAFAFQYNNKLYKKYLISYRHRIDTTLNDTIVSEDIGTDVLLQYKNNTRRNRDLSAVIFLAVYGLNIIDAVVDAELSDFDVSDDLSIKISPEILPIYGKMKRNTIGINLCFNFK